MACSRQVFDGDNDFGPKLVRTATPEADRRKLRQSWNLQLDAREMLCGPPLSKTPSEGT